MRDFKMTMMALKGIKRAHVVQGCQTPAPGVKGQSTLWAKQDKRFINAMKLNPFFFFFFLNENQSKSERMLLSIKSKLRELEI